MAAENLVAEVYLRVHPPMASEINAGAASTKRAKAIPAFVVHDDTTGRFCLVALVAVGRHMVRGSG